MFFFPNEKNFNGDFLFFWMFRINVFKVYYSWILIIRKLSLEGTNLLGHGSSRNCLVDRFVCVEKNVSSLICD